MKRISISVDDVKQYLNKQIVVKTGKFKDESVVFTVSADASNISEVLESVKGSKNVIAIEYFGNPLEQGSLKDLDLSEVYTYCVVNIGDAFTEDDVQLYAGINPNLHIVFKVSDDFVDLREVWTYSSKYDNIRVSGGDLINLKGINWGTIPYNVYQKKGISCKDTISVEDFVPATEYGVLVLGEQQIKSTSGSSRAPRQTSNKPKVRKLSFADILNRS